MGLPANVAGGHRAKAGQAGLGDAGLSCRPALLLVGSEVFFLALNVCWRDFFFVGLWLGARIRGPRGA